MTGRVLRRKNYPAVILDHANLVSSHGLPDEDREWTLMGNKGNKQGEKESDIKVKTCPVCFAVQVSQSRICSYCGNEQEVQDRKIDHVDGELVEIDYDKLRKKKLQAQGKCQTQEELVEEGKRRGYKHPRAWAKYVFQARQRKKIYGN